MPNSQVSVVGNLTADPQLKFTNNGKPVANFTVAVSEGTKENPRTSYIDVVAWGSLGENCVNSLLKGLRVMVVGTITQRSWETDQGKRSKIEIVAECVGPDLRWHVATVVKAEAPSQGRFSDPSDSSAQIARIRAGLNAADVTHEYIGDERPF